MANDEKSRILQALTGLMRPVARFLMRAGISYVDFSEVAKKVFVDTATDVYGLRGRPTNISRVALLTGLTRKEVSQLKAITEVDNDVRGSHRSLPAEVLHRWHTNESYVDPATGLPRELTFVGEHPSFESLVRDCMRDIPPGAVRAELKRVGAIREGDDGVLHAEKREMVPKDSAARLAEGIETGLNPLAKTILFNSDPNNVNAARFQRIVSIPFARKEALKEIEEGLKRRLVQFTEELDDYLVRFEAREEDADNSSEVGVGIYYFREDE